MELATILELEADLDRLAELVAAFEPGGCDGPAAARLVRAFERGERVCAAGKALAAQRVDATNHWRRTGARSAADWLADETGSSFGQARSLLDRADAMGEHGALDEAVRRGAVSGEAAREIATTARRAPDAVTKLTRAAVTGTPLGEVRKAGAEARRRAEDDAARARRQHEQRRARTFTDEEGMVRLDAAMAPEVGAAFRSLWQPWIDREFVAARRAGRREPEAAYALDALLAMARAAADPAAPRPRRFGTTATTSSAASPSTDDRPDDPAPLGADPDVRTPVDAEPDVPPRAETAPDVATPVEAASVPARRQDPDFKAFIRVDLAALVRGRVEGGELCEIDGIGPVPVARVNEILASGNAFVVGLLTRGVDVVRMVHHGRQPLAIQRSALQWLYPTCAHPGCTDLAHLENDHAETWAATGRTCVADMQRLCIRHHDAKSRADQVDLRRRRWREQAGEDRAGPSGGRRIAVGE